MGYDCPTCERSFDSRRGLGVHHSHAHDERLPNRTCDRCGERFYSDYSKRYCSNRCLDRSDAYEGENNPNYDGGTEPAVCDRCGDDFTYYPSTKQGKYCPKCVETADWRTPPSLTGSSNPRWKGGMRELDCHVCGETVERYPSELEAEVVVCGHDCRAEWLSEQFAGDGHPNWNGGDIGPYGPGWNETRRRALERDDHACVVCGVDDNTLGRNPDVHHLRPVRWFDRSPEHDVSDAHYLQNVVSLCPSCHRKADVGTITSDQLRRAASIEDS